MKRFACLFLGVSTLAMPTAFAGGYEGSGALLRKFSPAQLCFLEQAATEADASRVRDALALGKLACDDTLRHEGKLSLEQGLRQQRFRATTAALHRQGAERESRERRETQRLISCAAQARENGNYCY